MTNRNGLVSAATPPAPLAIQGVRIIEGHRIALWDPASRRRIRKAKSILQELLLPFLTPACTHVKGRGGVKGAVRALQANMRHFTFVARFDVASYYETIDHAILLSRLDQAGAPPDLREFVRQYLAAPDTTRSGVGLTAGGSLSPLLGALYLHPLDDAMQALAGDGSIFYRRFMDDFVILTNSRRRLRTAIRRVHQVLATLGMHVHEKKRFIGRTSAGFDFLGYRLHPARKLRPSTESVRRLKERARRLYEQGASPERLRQYVLRWCRWLWGGLQELVTRKGGTRRYGVRVLASLDLSQGNVRTQAFFRSLTGTCRACGHRGPGAEKGRQRRHAARVQEISMISQFSEQL